METLSSPIAIMFNLELVNTLRRIDSLSPKYEPSGNMLPF